MDTRHEPEEPQRPSQAVAPEAQETDPRERQRESGLPGGGQGRRDIVGESRVYPMSGGLTPSGHAELRGMAAWGQGARGAAGYGDAGGSELLMYEGQLLGGLTAGPSGEPTIDIHQHAPTPTQAANAPASPHEPDDRT